MIYKERLFSINNFIKLGVRLIDDLGLLIFQKIQRIFILTVLSLYLINIFHIIISYILITPLLLFIILLKLNLGIENLFR